MGILDYLGYKEATPVDVICPRCRTVYQRKVEVEHQESPFAQRLNGYLIITCLDCGGKVWTPLVRGEGPSGMRANGTDSEVKQAIEHIREMPVGGKKDTEGNKAFMLLDPAFAKIAAEYKRRYGFIWFTR